MYLRTELISVDMIRSRAPVNHSTVRPDQYSTTRTIMHADAHRILIIITGKCYFMHDAFVVKLKIVKINYKKN